MHRALRCALALTLALPLSAPLRAQGCAQCRDNMQATPPSVQRAYRHAIELFAVTGSTIFLGGLTLLRRASR